MLKTMKYAKSFGSSLMRRPRKVHAETQEESFASVSVRAWAGEEDEDRNEPFTFGSADSTSDDDCDSILSDDTVCGRRYRTVTLYGIVDFSSLPEAVALSRASDMVPLTTVNGVAWYPRTTRVRLVRTSYSRGDVDSDLLSSASLNTRYVEESYEPSDDEHVWEDNSYVRDEVMRVS
eukprot:TRINITY_DN11929_c0_g1_i1.p1 TRINITY_DN11929_c0_g1~~TRINITY_DN11929_c0_g1_i1.p1  ORF type:complete len:177 (+),score=18.80 TRINITY_DN11929_c0_g1_i1:78-608(+)